MFKLIVLLGVTLFFASCTKTITPRLDTGTAQLVIEGIISDTSGPYYVSVVNSADFYASNNFTGVSGAVVTITDGSGSFNDLLTETSPGLYVTHLLKQGIPGVAYLLKVVVNGKTYNATSIMPVPVALDSVSFDTSDTTQINARTNYQDPKGIVNYYKYSLTINGVTDKRFQTFKDFLSDGKYIRDKVDSDTSEVKRNDLVQLSLVGIDKNVYTCLREAEQVAYSNDALAAPATPVTNISGGCLGYFSAQTVSSKKAVVKF